jgi:aminoglycoside/choline kinase family phosphotransferase
MQELLQETRLRFPDLTGQVLEMQPLEKGGSDRFFYRISCGDGRTMILTKYGSQREENRHYVDIARFLARVGVRVPEIYVHDEGAGLIWMEDLGDRDLWSYRNEPVRGALYRSALDELLKLHNRASGMHDGVHPKLQPGFDAALYLWEQGYFFENCLGRVFGRELAGTQFPRLGQIAEELAALPRVFVHRDFQSQNLVVKDGHACFIDFQGMRFGLRQYDLASLLLDPYVSLTESERAEFLAYYRAQLPDGGGSDFERVYRWCAMQRLMQALGAYGFLGLVKGRSHFLEHIPAALGNLRQVVAGIEGLEDFSALLMELKA